MLYLSGNQGGDQQIGARIAYNELDLVLFFCDPSMTEGAGNVNDIARLCDQYNVPFASNVRHGGGPHPGPQARRPGLAGHRQP